LLSKAFTGVKVNKIKHLKLIKIIFSQKELNNQTISLLYNKKHFVNSKKNINVLSQLKQNKLKFKAILINSMYLFDFNNLRIVNYFK